MKKLVTSFFVILLLISPNLFAQDTLDVAWDAVGTLNIAIEGDTLPDGSRNENRVYRLARDGYYLIDGILQIGGGYTLRIVGAEGAGARPLLIPATEEGSSSRLFHFNADAELKNLFCTDINDLCQISPKNMMRLYGDSATVIIDNCFFDGDAQAFVRMNNPDEKIYITNSIFRNAASGLDPWDGLFFSARGGYQHTIHLENCTFFVAANRFIQYYDYTVRNLYINHCTFVQFAGVDGGNFDTGQTVNLTFTNNVLMDVGYEGEDNPDGQQGMLVVDVLNTEDFGVDEEREVLLANNVYGWTTEISDWLDSKEDTDRFVFTDSTSDSIANVYSNMAIQNNIEEEILFSDPPEIAQAVTYAEHRYIDSNDLQPIRVDRNGVGPANEIETLGLSEDEYDFDYPTTQAAYTHADGGLFPAGDLNWFPAKKAEWESWVTGIKSTPGAAMPKDFALEQNYPNPFNPTTTINYNLSIPSNVKMVIYNALGQQVKVLVNNQSQKAGSYSVQWDGKDDSGNVVSSGIYFYRLDSDNLTMSKKMLMLK